MIFSRDEDKRIEYANIFLYVRDSRDVRALHAESIFSHRQDSRREWRHPMDVAQEE